MKWFFFKYLSITICVNLSDRKHSRKKAAWLDLLLLDKIKSKQQQEVTIATIPGDYYEIEPLFLIFSVLCRLEIN